MSSTLTFAQLSTVLNAITQQATGQAAITPINTGEFISVAQTALLTGYDTLATSISQVLSRTIFSIRPYYRKFSGIMVDEIKYGNHVRKLNSVDKPFEDDSRFTIVDGQSIDQYKVCKPQVLQTNFYGAEVFQKCLTIYRDQLDQAFSGPDEFGRFISMIMQNAMDMIEQAHDVTARATVNNFIGGVLSYQDSRTINLLEEYNTATGGSYTLQTIYAPENFSDFSRWVFGRISAVRNMLTERSQMFNTTITGSPVSRHTPIERQRLYLNSQFMSGVDASVLSTTFNDKYLSTGRAESVGFWQNIQSPTAVQVTPTRLLADGTLASDQTVVNPVVIGVLFDEDALGITVVNQWSASTPFNARGGYSNIYWHFTDRYWNDFTENGVVFTLANSTITAANKSKNTVLSK